MGAFVRINQVKNKIHKFCGLKKV